MPNNKFFHEPNPFDFVHFANEKPILKSYNDWLETDDLMTGFLTCNIKALNPVHSIGIQDSNETKINKSFFYEHNGTKLIKGSSLKGVLRKFIEAAFNCWVSEITPFYEKEKNHRNLPFNVIDKAGNGKFKPENQLKPSLNDRFVFLNDGKEMDLASFIFGRAANEGKGNKSKIQIDNIKIPRDFLSFNHQLPDIDSNAFMGSPNPSAKTWWYHRPYGIWKRKKNRGYEICFIGKEYWGRKFYFHQNPKSCISKYTPDDWPKIYKFPIECIEPGKESEVFKIFFEDLPYSLLLVLIWALNPDVNMKHKIGFGKAYGYGSIDIIIKNIFIKRNPENDERILNLKNDNGNYSCSYQLLKQSLSNTNLNNLPHEKSINKLYKILFYDEGSKQIFMYPPFNQNGFKKLLNSDDIKSVLTNTNYKNDFWELSEENAYDIAKKFYDKGIKSTIHFQVYQDKATNYKTIMNKQFPFNKGEK